MEMDDRMSAYCFRVCFILINSTSIITKNRKWNFVKGQRPAAAALFINHSIKAV
jgi:hypothetical protein